jgi:hypothetical protein
VAQTIWSIPSQFGSQDFDYWRGKTSLRTDKGSESAPVPHCYEVIALEILETSLRARTGIGAHLAFRQLRGQRLRLALLRLGVLRYEIV